MNKIQNFIKYMSTHKEVQKILITHFAIIVIFAIIYKEINNNDLKSFSNEKKMDMFDAFYFSAITHTTVGFGDISPETKYAKLSSMTHVLLVFFIGFLEINQII